MQKCIDSRLCFARKENGECSCLTLKTKADVYDDGQCPFCKPRREYTNGKYYPRGENYKGR